MNVLINQISYLLGMFFFPRFRYEISSINFCSCYVLPMIARIHDLDNVAIKMAYSLSIFIS